MSPDFPLACHSFGTPFAQKPRRQDRADFTPLWFRSKQRGLARELPAAELTRQLAAEVLENLRLLWTHIMNGPERPPSRPKRVYKKQVLAVLTITLGWSRISFPNDRNRQNHLKAHSSFRAGWESFARQDLTRPASQKPNHVSGQN